MTTPNELNTSGTEAARRALHSVYMLQSEWHLIGKDTEASRRLWDELRNLEAFAARSERGDYTSSVAGGLAFIVHAKRHADVAADLLMEARSQAPDTWRGWYDDALNHIDITRKDLDRVANASAHVAGEAQPVIHQHGFAADNQRLRAINESLDKQLEEVTTECDNREVVIDKLVDLVLGANRAEWSSEYDYSKMLIKVEERMKALMQR